MKAQLRVTQASGYTVHEMQMSPSGILREYVSADGKVFAVSWRGPRRPDLQQILGNYYSDYQLAAQAPHPGHRHLIVQRPDLVIRSNGHMRAFFGSAYLPESLPAHFSIADIQ